MENFKKVVGVVDMLPGTAAPKAFRGNVDLSKYDDRIDPDASCVNMGPNKNWINPIPCSKTNEEIDRQHHYNQMMSKTGTYGMGYIFS